jgi:cytochrome aa3-600 menaquinol oxidase subunit 2
VSGRPAATSAPARRPRRLLAGFALLVAALATSGCGRTFVLFHPQGPVAAAELHLFVLAAAIMGGVVLLVCVLLAVTLVRFRSRAGARPPAPAPERRWLEVAWFVVPALILTVVAIPMTRETFRLARVPDGPNRLVIDVTSLSWKWLFEYPGQGVATVNYVVLPAGEPVVFRLTADSAMNTLWIPALGGMEYAMPGEVLPLWLEADHPGTYWGHSGQFSGVDFAKMFFAVRVVTPQAFGRWAHATATTAPPLTEAGYHRLLSFGTTGEQAYSSYPSGAFPAQDNGFSVSDGRYLNASQGGGMRMGLLPAVPGTRPGD